MTLREANLIKEYVDTFHIPVDKEKLKIQAQIENEKEYLISPNRRCVFLGQNNLCTIYEVRPSACRNYFVFNPKEDCDTFNDKTTGKTLVNFDLESVAPIMALMSISPTNTLPRQLLKIL
jgi:Fe-S-cluster containining protein